MQAAQIDEAEGVIEAGLPSALSRLQGRQWADADIPQTVAALAAQSAAVLPRLQTWERYRSELLTQSVHPSPLHSSAEFFAQHIELFGANHCAVLTRLLGMAEDGRLHSITRAVAVWDVGEVARTGDQGKRLIERVRGKQRLLRLADAVDVPDDVRHVAVSALEKLLVPRWDEFARLCQVETAHAITKPVRRVGEDDIKWRMQTYAYKFWPDMGGWPSLG